MEREMEWSEVPSQNKIGPFETVEYAVKRKKAGGINPPAGGTRL
jgi:hypothetical protein